MRRVLQRHGTVSSPYILDGLSQHHVQDTLASREGLESQVGQQS
jgi:hypothetical protein